MSRIERSIKERYGHKVRVRTSGICVEDNKLLLVAHSGLGSDLVWLPPGGGLDFGVSSEANLKREFEEETGLEIEVEDFLFVFEYRHSPLHAIELYYKVKRISGELVIGYDPEQLEESEIIKKVEFFSYEEINLLPEKSRHQIFSYCKSIAELQKLHGYFLFEE